MIFFQLSWQLGIQHIEFFKMNNISQYFIEERFSYLEMMLFGNDDNALKASISHST